MRIYDEDFDVILKESFPFLNNIVATEKGFGAFFFHRGKERFIKVIYEEYELSLIHISEPTRPY